MTVTNKPQADAVGDQKLSMSEQDVLRAEQVRELFSQAPLGLLGTVLCALVVTYFLIGKADATSLLFWFGGLLLVSLLRYVQLVAFRILAPEKVEQHWLNVFDIGVALSGLAWGALALIAFPSGSVLYQGFLATVVGGIGAVSIMTYAMSARAAPTFLLLSLSPIAVRLHLEDTSLTYSLEFLLVFATGILAFLSLRVHRSMIGTLLLSLKNKRLVEGLQISKVNTEKLNTRLLEENKIRKKIEEAALEAESRSRNLSDAAFEGIVIHDKGLVLDANYAIAEMVGLEQHELLGKSLIDMVAPESRDMVIEKISAPDELPFEVIGMRANGERFTAEVCSRDYPYRGKRVRVTAIRDITNERQAENSVQRYEQHLGLLVEKTPLAVIEWDKDFKVKTWNKSAERIFGFTEAEAVDKHACELILPPNTIDVVNDIWERITNQSGGERSTNENKTKSGEVIICEWYNTPIFNSCDEIETVVSLANDITQRIKAQEALYSEKEFAEITLASIGDGVLTTDSAGTVTYINPITEALTGWSLDECLGKPVHDIYRVTDEFGLRLHEDPVQRCIHNAERIEMNQNLSLQNRDGRRFPVIHTVSPIFDRNGVVVGSVLVIRDISELKMLESRLIYQASHDPLTGLVNRHEFEMRVEHAIATASIDNKRHVLMYLDLDQFKVVNDTCGHIAGDELLKQISTQLFNRLRDTDILARLGGDEFGVLLEGCPIEKGENIAEMLRNAIRDYRFIWQDKTFEIGVSIGLVAITADSTSLTDILSAADSACYVAKDLGRNRSHIYSESDDILAARHGEMRWVQQINEAISENRFILYAQKIDALNGNSEELHFETLVRMLGQNGETIPPGAFIPAAERYDLMSNIDRWVIKDALRMLDEVLALNPEKEFVCALNISGQSLCDNDFLDFAIEQINSSRVSSHSICFEITETAAISNLNQAMHIISTLREIGCRFSLDDFGSGLSSFAYLKNMKVNYLKIDGVFVRDILDDPISSSMVEAINQIGHVMGLETIAEFVEDDEIRNHLRSIGVNYAQGFGVHRPAPFMEVFKKN